MSTREIYNQMLARKAEILTLRQEIKATENKYEVENKITEVLILQNELALLDELNRRTLVRRFEGEKSNIFTKLAMVFARG